MKLIVINGTAESGKDEFVEFIRSEYKALNHSTIDPVKAAMTCLGWNGIKTDRDRQMMVCLKQLWIKWGNGNSCVDWVEKMYYTNLTHDMMFIHCREPEEIQKIVDRIKGTVTLLISSKRGKVLENGADNVVENYKYDYIIFNNGTLDELRENAIEFANTLMKGGKNGCKEKSC